jgi:hypothetical protein
MNTIRIPHFLALVCLLTAPAAAFLGCSTVERTPEAIMFSTLQASAAGIDSFRNDYEAARNAGNLTQEQFTKLDVAFNKANDAITEAAEALAAGMDATTPAGVDKLVKELLDLVLEVVPSRYQTNSSQWRI